LSISTEVVLTFEVFCQDCTANIKTNARNIIRTVLAFYVLRICAGLTSGKLVVVHPIVIWAQLLVHVTPEHLVLLVVKLEKVVMKLLPCTVCGGVVGAELALESTRIVLL
jgi:hypothetical protein